MNVFVTTHVLSGVLVGRAARGRLATAFAAGVASHLLLDACPHWGCDMEAPGAEEEFLRLATRDGVAGLVVIPLALIAVPRRDRAATVAAIAGAVLLDLDKPFLHFVGRNPFPRAVASIHRRVQNESPDGMPKEIAYGMLFALLDAAAIVQRRRTIGVASCPAS